jgi:hypothetical protein
VAFGVRGDRGGERQSYLDSQRKDRTMSLLWIILIVVLVLALLGFFGRGRF